MAQAQQWPQRTSSLSGQGAAQTPSSYLSPTGVDARSPSPANPSASNSHLPSPTGAPLGAMSRPSSVAPGFPHPAPSTSFQQSTMAPGPQTPGASAYTNGAYANGFSSIRPGSASSNTGPVSQWPRTGLQSAPQTPGAPSQYTNAAFTAQTAPQTPGIMGPPTRPAARATKEDFGSMDVLAGTGINEEEEAARLAEYHAGTSFAGSRSGLLYNPPGAADSFYGAGYANQPGADGRNANQNVVAAELAKRAWDESAQRKAVMQSHEQNNQFLQYTNLYQTAGKVVKEYGLELNIDHKNAKSQTDLEHEPPKITVSTRVGAGGAMISIYGAALAPDTHLIDQLALLSLASKHRIRELVEDANRIAAVRQQTSHGIIPVEWADAGVQIDAVGDDQAANGMANSQSLKRPHSSITGDASDDVKPPPNEIVLALKKLSKVDRDAEEERLLKRQRRTAAAAEQAPPVKASTKAAATPAADSPAPDSIAPEPKATGKKGGKGGRSTTERVIAPTGDANRTTNAFLGIPRKKGKTYSWMTGGAGGGDGGVGGGSSFGTPSRTPAGGATPNADGRGGSAESIPQVVQLTRASRNQLGVWKEYGEQGKNIQLRDWVIVLERDGREKEALQRAYNKLDSSESQPA